MNQFIIIKMEENILKFGKELFVSFKRENINQHYEVIAKVNLYTFRNWERAHLVPSTKVGRGALRVLGGLLKRFKNRRSRMSLCL